MQLEFTTDEILAEHDYAEPHSAAGQRLHGGFDAAGRYLPPRTRNRPQAVENWATALRARGGEPLAIGLELLGGVRFPNLEQQKLLLRHGLEQSLWNSLTTIGRIEARGRFLAEIPAPSFAGIVDGDVSKMTLGHLGKGLFAAHGYDEGGVSPKAGEQTVGGHDAMWFATRDLAFGAGRYPLPAPPEMGGGQPQNIRVMPDLPPGHEQLLRFLLNLLMIEIRAFITFDQHEKTLRDPTLFAARRKEADEAADLVTRIREDERVHVAYLCNLFGELREATIHSVTGEEKPGTEVIDPAWKRQVKLSTESDMILRQRVELRDVLHGRIAAHGDAARVREEFDALTDPGAFED
jgi:hypothetical protein